MKRQLVAAALLPAACAGLSGCWAPPPRSEILVSTAPPGAECMLSRLGQPVGMVGSTPGIALVDPSASPIMVTCRRRGFTAATVAMPPDDTSPTFAPILFGYPPYAQRRADIALVPAPPR